MKEVSEEELKIMKGGISGWGLVGIGALTTLFIGILNGIVHPQKCN